MQEEYNSNKSFVFSGLDINPMLLCNGMKKFVKKGT